MTKHLKVFGFIAVNPEACFPLYSISYLLDENCTKSLFKRNRGRGKEEAISYKGNRSIETRKVS